MNEIENQDKNNLIVDKTSNNFKYVQILNEANSSLLEKDDNDVNDRISMNEKDD